MSTIYTYNKVVDFPNDDVNPTDLAIEIEESSISSGILEGIETDNNDCFIHFTNPIPTGILNGLVAAHSGNAGLDLSVVYFNAYDNVGGVNVDSVATVVLTNVRQSFPDGVFVHNSGEVTFNYGGVYRVEFDGSIDIDTGTNRSQSEAWLEKNSSELNGTRRPIYNRTANNGADNMSATSIFTFAKGDVLRIRANRTNGSSNLVTLADGSTITIERISP